MVSSLRYSLQKEQKLSKYSVFEWNIGITNAYNRENIFYFNRIEYKRVNQLPFMPSAGLSLTFKKIYFHLIFSFNFAFKLNHTINKYSK